MIFGIGIDIVNIERIEHLMKRWGDLFLEGFKKGDSGVSESQALRMFRHLLCSQRGLQGDRTIAKGRSIC
jgi:hypothetical protein